ncbi:DUF6160 family protein [Litoribacillus peritrichatus]
MKRFHKLALAAAIMSSSAQSFAMETLNDDFLSDMTGQSGVSIDLKARVLIDEVVYTDTAAGPAPLPTNIIENGSGISIDLSTRVLIDEAVYTDTAHVALDALGNPVLKDGGQIAFGAIRFGGANVGDKTPGASNTFLDDIKIDIDVNESGDLEILIGTQDFIGFLQGTSEVDFGLTLGDSASGVAGLQLRSADGTVNTNLIGDMSISGVLGPVAIIVSNDGAGDTSGFINAAGFFAIDDGSIDVPILGVGISNLRIYQDANKGALGAAGVAQGGMAYFDVVVDTVDTAYSLANPSDIAGTATHFAVSDALLLDINSFNVDMDLDLSIGNSVATGNLSNLVSSSFGHVHMENLDISGTSLTIYGH